MTGKRPLVYAAFLLPCLQPVGYGGSKADTVRIERDQAPEQMRSEIERCIEKFPKSTAFIEKLYLNRQHNS